MHYLQIGWKNHYFLWTLSCGWWERVDERWIKTTVIPPQVQKCLIDNLNLVKEMGANAT